MADDPAEHRALVTAAQRGDHAAFTALVVAFQPRIRRFLGQQTTDPDLAEDLTQETFLEAFRSLPQLREPAAFRAWLFTIARRQLAHARLRPRDRPMPASPERGHSSATAAEEGSRARVRAVLAALPSAWREALLLHEVEGFTTAEVAAIQGITPAAARKRLSRAHRAFRMRYAAMEREEADR